MSFEKRDGKSVIYNIETGAEYIGAAVDCREIFAQGGWATERKTKKTEAVVEPTMEPTVADAPEPVAAVEEIQDVVAESEISEKSEDVGTVATEPTTVRRGRPTKK